LHRQKRNLAFNFRMVPDIQISDLLRHKRPVFSLEFFPPKNDEGVEKLKDIALSLKVIAPDFVSVTYGAGGSTQLKTMQVSRLLRKDLGYTVMPHLTCVGSTRDQLKDIIAEIHSEGFRNIMTLRGDAPQGQTDFIPCRDGLRYASDLVALIKSTYPDICMGVGGYPEKHPECADPVQDLKNLKVKVDQGAHFITTQLFFSNALYFEFVKKTRALGINVPILPGLMPVVSLSQVKRFTQMCGASLPEELISNLERAGDDPIAAEDAGIDWALSQIKGLIAGGAPGVHLYILNRSRAALMLAQKLANEPTLHH